MKRSGKWRKINAAELVPGDRVGLGSGSNVPADCRLDHEHPIDIDQAALTGESLPVTMYKNDVAKMGSTCVRGETEAIVASTGKNTFFGKTAGAGWLWPAAALSVLLLFKFDGLCSLDALLQI